MKPRDLDVSGVDPDSHRPDATWAWAPPDGRVEILDITAALDRFRGAPAAPPLAWCDIAPAEPNGVIDITSDVLYIVDAFRGFPYPFDGPPPCP